MSDLIGIISVASTAGIAIFGIIYKLIINSKCKVISCFCCKIERDTDHEINIQDNNNNNNNNNDNSV